MPKIPEDLFTRHIGEAARPVLERVRKGEIAGEEAITATLEAMRTAVEAAVNTIWHTQDGKAAAKKAQTPES